MKVTVAMPAFDVAPYIEEAIDSVLAQDFRGFELIIVDDRSRDDTWRRIRKYAAHPDVRVYRNRRNLGVGATRNRITELARGRYVMPCDGDDILLPGALSRLSRVLDRKPTVGAVYADLLELSSDRRGMTVEPPRICGTDHRRGWDLLDNLINHPGSMIRRRLMQRVGGYDERVYSVDDWSLWLKLAEICRIVYLPGEIYYVWRRRPSSITRTDRAWARDVARIRQEAIGRRYGASGERLEVDAEMHRRVGRHRQRTI